MIILDPPTVSGARATSWAQKRDYPDLIAAACALLPEEGGHLWVSSNTHRGPSVLKHVEAGLARAARPAALLELGGLPPDFPTPVGWPAARYLEVCQLAVGAGRRALIDAQQVPVDAFDRERLDSATALAEPAAATRAQNFNAAGFARRIRISHAPGKDAEKRDRRRAADALAASAAHHEELGDVHDVGGAR